MLTAVQQSKKTVILYDFKLHYIAFDYILLIIINRCRVSCL